MGQVSIPEVKVVIATAAWLHNNIKGCLICAISVPASQDQKTLMCDLGAAGISLDREQFKRHGPDIVAKDKDNEWRIECKGLGKGRQSTLRNNCDRALASAVSYFDRKTGINLGIALPRNNEYLCYLKDRVPRALREVLGLTVFLYDAHENTVEIFDPLSDLPHPPTRKGHTNIII